MPAPVQVLSPSPAPIFEFSPTINSLKGSTKPTTQSLLTTLTNMSPAVSSPNGGTSKAPQLQSTKPRAVFAFDAMEDALAAFKNGEFLVVMDDEDRENEGDLIVAASLCTTEKMAWMIKHTSGYICIGMPGNRLDALSIPMMVPNNEERHRTAYTVTVDCIHNTSTGISAHDRALTARTLASSSSSPADFTRPGHMVPLRAREGGVLTRKGHTESSVDLCRLTGLPEAGLLCELVNDDEMGTMARRDDCRAFADRWGLKMISVEMLAQWRRSHGV